MAFNKDANLSYHVFKDYNINFDEKSNSFGTLRLIQWVSGDNQPDESKAKLEIRKMTITPEGKEQPLKGYTFGTENGPHELAEGLIASGFGHTKNILKSLSSREDFKDSVMNIDKDDDDNETSDSLFDMRSFLMNINNDSEE